MKNKNNMEDIVWQHLDDVIAIHKNVCACEQCRNDIAALSLNFLPQRYVVTEKGEAFIRIKELEHQFRVDILSAISNAIIIVHRQPNHGQVK